MKVLLMLLVCASFNAYSQDDTFQDMGEQQVSQVQPIETNMYNNHGAYNGTAASYSNGETTLTDSHGHYNGKLVTSGGQTMVYDKHGHYAGSVGN